MGRRTEANERGHEYIPYGLVSLIALVWIGGMLKFLADGGFPTSRPTEVDGLLVGGLLVLYALTIPLVIRIGRAARRDESGALTDGRRLAGQLDGMPVVVWTTDRKLRLTGSAGGGLVSLAVPPGRPRVPMEELFREGRSTRALVHAHRLALMGETVACGFETDDGVFRGAVQPLRERGRTTGVFGIALADGAGWVREDLVVLPEDARVIDLSDARAVRSR